MAVILDKSPVSAGSKATGEVRFDGPRFSDYVFVSLYKDASSIAFRSTAVPKDRPVSVRFSFDIDTYDTGTRGICAGDPSDRMRYGAVTFRILPLVRSVTSIQCPTLAPGDSSTAILRVTEGNRDLTVYLSADAPLSLTQKELRVPPLVQAVQFWVKNARKPGERLLTRTPMIRVGTIYKSATFPISIT